MPQPIPLFPETSASRAQRLHDEAIQATRQLTDEWIAATQALSQLAQLVTSAPNAPPGVRHLARLQAATLTATAASATSIVHRFV